MYDRRIDALLAARELGSFTRAAERLHVSPTALIKQVTGFEQEYGVTVFERTHRGVVPTVAGSRLLEDARDIRRQATEAIERARSVALGSGSVRLGKSMMAPARETLRLWHEIQAAEPMLRLEIVPVESLYDSDSAMLHLGEEVDVLQSSYSTLRWGGSTRLLKIVERPFVVDVIASSPLASLDSIGPEDLRGVRLCVFSHANDAMDDERDRLESAGVDIRDVDHFDFSLFNEAEREGDAVLTVGSWSGLHPAFVGVPLRCERKVPVFLAYARNPRPEVSAFVRAYEEVLRSHGLHAGAM